MKLLFAFLATCLSLTVSSQSIDQEKSQVNFEIGNMWINTVEGTFKKMTGSVVYSIKNPSASSFSVCVDASTVNTDSEKRDEHLKTEDFFAVDRYPTICIESSKISSSKEGLKFTGTLTMLGVTKTISFPFTFDNKVLRGTFEINRSDFGLGADTGSFAVAEEVEITIECT